MVISDDEDDDTQHITTHDDDMCDIVERQETKAITVNLDFMDEFMFKG
jgi:hypothetical protein